jgi:hypothetical protein
MEGPSLQQFSSGRLLLLPLFHESPKAAYSAIAPLFASPFMTQFNPSVHILSENIPSSFHVDPMTVATAAEVSVLNDLLIDEPAICALLLDDILHSWQREAISCCHLLQACCKLSHDWAQRPSLFDAAVAVLATTCSLEQWNCAQRCLCAMRVAVGAQVAVIADVDFPSGPIRPSAAFNLTPTLTASLVLSPSLSFPPADYALSQPPPSLCNLNLSEATSKCTM